eukprot:3549900-Lingulodinium_polyedra.AAC.2
MGFKHTGLPCHHPLPGQLDGLVAHIPGLPVPEPLEHVLDHLGLSPGAEDQSGQLDHLLQQDLVGPADWSSSSHGKLPDNWGLEGGTPHQASQEGAGACELLGHLESSKIHLQHPEELLPVLVSGTLAHEGQPPRILAVMPLQ